MLRARQLLITASGLFVMALGIFALRTLEDDESFTMLHGCLTLGGALLIAGLFSFRMPSHGIVGAGVVALLGASSGLLNLPDLARFLIGERPRAHAPLIEFAVTILCLIVLIQSVRWLMQERIRRMLEEE